MAYYVQLHLKDISIRLALGGSAPKVLRLVVGQGMRVVIIGVIVGLATAWLSTRFMTSLLFEVAAVDVATFAAVSAIMLGVAPIGCVVPALDAATSQPASVLRSE